MDGQNDANAVPDNQNGIQLTPEDYLIKARQDYKNMFEELQQRSKQAAQMNYFLAARYDNRSFIFQLTASAVGALAIGVFSQTKIFQDSLTLEIVSLSSGIAVFGLPLIFAGAKRLWDFISDPSSFYSGRAKDHVTFAADWQLLELKIRSAIIRLDDPNVTVKEYSDWWDAIIKERRELCLAFIPEDVHEKFAPTQKPITVGGQEN